MANGRILLDHKVHSRMADCLVCLDYLRRGRVGFAPSTVRRRRYGKDGKDCKDICYIKPDKNFAFGFGEVVNPAPEEGAHMHPVAWTITSLDAATEAKIRALVEKAVA
jgi:hypothetical protein